MKVGKPGNPDVSAMGPGCMGMSQGYGSLPDRKEMIRLIRQAYENFGCTFFDTASVWPVCQ